MRWHWVDKGDRIFIKLFCTNNVNTVKHVSVGGCLTLNCPVWLLPITVKFQSPFDANSLLWLCYWQTAAFLSSCLYSLITFNISFTRLTFWNYFTILFNCDSLPIAVTCEPSRIKNDAPASVCHQVNSKTINWYLWKSMRCVPKFLKATWFWSSLIIH